MQIEHLTEAQVEMLDFMWNELDSEQDFLDWYDALDSEQQRQADLLQRLVIMESIDEEMASQTKYPEARRVIDRISQI